MPHPPTPPTGTHVLVVEDQHDIAANIWDYLELRGYQVDHRADGASALARATQKRFHLIVLDVGLPKMDGLELCRRLRQNGSTLPIIMLTARDTLEDKLRGFEAGADDYLVKPFEMRELEARIKALLKNRSPRRAPLTAGGLSYNPDTLTAQRENRSVRLTRMQGSVLGLLLAETPNIVTYAQILEVAWPFDKGDLPALQTQIYELRQLIDKPFAAPLIHTVRGLGYRLDAHA